ARRVRLRLRLLDRDRARCPAARLDPLRSGDRDGRRQGHTDARRPPHERGGAGIPADRARGGGGARLATRGDRVWVRRRAGEGEHMTAATLPPMPAASAAPRPVLTSMTLVGAHFGAATLYLTAGALGLVWVAPELAIGAYPSPQVAGVTHLFTLGWLTMMIFGALHQLLPVGLGAPMRSLRVGQLSFWCFAPGVALFAAG